MAELNGMQGNEIADDFILKGHTGGAWRHGWDTFKGNFWKIIVINILSLLTFVPGIAIVLVRQWYIIGLGSLYPFNTTVGNFPPEDTVGLSQSLTLSADLLFYALFFVAGFIAAVGVAGAIYCIRKLLKTNGEFKIKSYFHGIKVNYFNALLPIEIFLAFLYGCFLTNDNMKIVGATGGNFAAAVTAFVFMVIATVLIGLYLLWVLAVGESYRVKFKYLFRNAFILLIATPIQTVFMAGFSLIPVWFMLLGSFWRIIGYILMIFFGLSFSILCWFEFANWTFDRFITPAVQAEKEAARAQKSEKELAAERAQEAKRQALELLAAGKSELIAHPIKPIERGENFKALGKTFTRGDISAAEESRAEIAKQVKDYEKEHENDEVFVEYNKMFAEREKALEDTKDKKGKSKKISADNLLR